jgi:hypothetical protein
MLAEKFFLVLETILGNRCPDGAPNVRSKGPFVPIVGKPLSTGVDSTGGAPRVRRKRSFDPIVVTPDQADRRS